MSKSTQKYLEKSMETNSFLIGITGGFGSGKSTSASFFESKGFKKIILSLFLEEEAKKRGFKRITRKILQDLGNEWRKNFGRGNLAEKAIDFIKKNKIEKAVIDGIRNAGEVERLKKEKNFILLGIVSNKKNRFERLKNLKRREKLTWEIFKKLDRRDMGVGQKQAGLHVVECIALSDIFIDNNGTKEEFERKLPQFLKEII